MEHKKNIEKFGYDSVGGKKNSDSQNAVTAFNSWHLMKWEKRYKPHSAFIKRIYNWWQILYIINWRHCTGRMLSLAVLLMKIGELCLLELLFFLVNQFQFKCQYQKFSSEQKAFAFLSDLCLESYFLQSKKIYLISERDWVLFTNSGDGVQGCSCCCNNMHRVIPRQLGT